MSDKKYECSYIVSDDEITKRFNSCNITDWEEDLIEEEILSVTGIPNVSKELCSIAGKNSYRNKIQRGDAIGFDGLPSNELIKVCSMGGKVKGKFKDYSWWYNGDRFIRSIEQPKGFYKYHAPNNPGKETKDTYWWNDGRKNKRSKECPGDGWQKGRRPANFGPNPGMRCWWTNGIDSVLSEKCPGVNWRKGRIIKGNK